MSDFAALQTAISGLLAHRRALEMTGQNITNANTPGYTRRRVELVAAGPAPIGGVWSKFPPFGRGVEVDGVTRLRDEFTDFRMRRELGADGAAQRMAKIYTSLEQLVPEPSDTGIAAQLADLWGAWDDAALNPSSLPARTALLERASNLASTLGSTATSMLELRSNLVTELQNSVSAVNADADQVATLTATIVSGKVAGVDTGDLEDQRDVLLDRLARATGAVVRRLEGGRVDVSVGGMPLVSEATAERLTLDTSGALDPPFSSLPVMKATLRWQRGGYAVAGLNGDLQALVLGANDVVPRALSDVDNLAAAVVTQVNALHRTGQGLDVANDVNLDFFDPAGVTAQTMALSSDVAGQPSRVALGAAGAGQLDASLGHAIGALGVAPGGPDALFRSFVGRMGVEVQATERRAAVQAQMVGQLTEARDSVSGVNLDEEMADIVASQRAYEASARVLTVVDEMLDQLINRTGTVGR